MTVLSPWAYGSVDPVFEYALFVGVGIVAALWGAISILQRKLIWFACPVALCIALIFMLGVFQLVPMPSWILSVASPTAASLNRDLRPAQPEIIAPGDPPATSNWTPTISVYPEATRQELYRWLAVFVLFAAVRNAVASTGSLKRLAWISLANGIALSIFAVYQFFATRPQAREVFGYGTSGDAFGPFICRNNFPDYINLCIGLAVGLLLVNSRSENDTRAMRTHKAQALVEQNAQDQTTFSVLSILHSPLQLWLSVGLALMVGAVVCSMSRGGVAALVIGAIGVLILRGTAANRRVTRPEVLAAPIILAIGFIAWIGINPLESRLTNWQSGLFGDARITIWKNLLPLAFKFPVFGSGYGTLPYVEPLNRQFEYPGYHGTVFIDHAHNDYLEALVEGGILRLAFSIGIVYYLLHYGRQAMRRHEIRTPGRLALGAMIGVIAIAAHSVVDFGVTTPAIACMATVVAAQLAAMARSDPSQTLDESSPNVVTLSLGGYGGIVAAIAFLAIGLVIAGHGSTMTLVHNRRINAYNAMHKSGVANPAEAAIQLSNAAAKSRFDANLRAELGQVYLDAGRKEIQHKKEVKRLTAAIMFAAGPLGSLGSAVFWNEADSRNLALQREQFDQFVRPGLQQMIAARDLCPLLAKPQQRLAIYAFDSKLADGPTMAQSDSTEAYWRRALELAPFDADLYYFAGLSLIESGHPDSAWPLWRKSLDRMPTHARAIVAVALQRLGAEKTISLVLPDDSRILLDAASALANDPTQAASQRSLLIRAREILTAQLDKDGNAFHQLGQTHQMLHEINPALSAYKAALERSPYRSDWRYEYARLLYEVQTTATKKEALDQLNDALRENPNHGPALELRALIQNELKQN